MNYKNTMISCFVGYIVQAVVNNFVPLLFITLQNEYGISLGKITLLVTVNFGVQLMGDFLSAFFIDKIGYRSAAVAAHIFSAAGLMMLTFMPNITDPFLGILISVCIYAIGGGFIEVIISPIVESCPTDNKEKAMSLLHSFYCWGHVGVVLLSTLFFRMFGIENWRALAYIWSCIPIINGILFSRVPIAPLIEGGEKGMSLKELFASRIFWLLMVMMVCSGAGEQAVSQWASFFAEKGLNISKTAGDLAGPMMFAVFMGISRAFYGRYGDKIDLDKFMTASSILCICSYMMISLVKFPVINLIGCALCGLSVGIMWPGTISKAAASVRNGGTALFSMLALAGDLGCAGGPTLVGFVSDIMNHNMKCGILAGVIFPIILVICTVCIRLTKSEHNV